MSQKKKDDSKNRPFSSALVGLKKKLEEDAAKAALEKAKPATSGSRPVPPARPGSKPKPIRVDAREEEESFHRMMSGVLPLGEAKATRLPKSTDPDLAKARQKPTPEALAARAKTEAEEVHEHLRKLVDGATRFEVSDDGKRVEGRRVDLPPQVLRSLRRGAMGIDARLDLHGKRAAEAREELGNFLRDKRTRGERCVLVIHGKGDHSPEGQGILRGEISAWLSQGRASEYVGAFATALDEDGGEGAVYVLLRRELG